MSIDEAYESIRDFLICRLQAYDPEEEKAIFTDILDMDFPYLFFGQIYDDCHEEINTILQYLAKQKGGKGLEVLFSNISELEDFIDEGIETALKYVARRYLEELRKEV